MKLQEHQPEENIKFIEGDVAEFKGIIMGILADDEVNYKEAYELLYWLDDHSEIAERYKNIYLKTKEVLEDDHLDRIEAIEMKKLLYNTLNTL
jgi:hypothetical protein